MEEWIYFHLNQTRTPLGCFLFQVHHWKTVNDFNASWIHRHVLCFRPEEETEEEEKGGRGEDSYWGWRGVGETEGAGGIQQRFPHIPGSELLIVRLLVFQAEMALLMEDEDDEGKHKHFNYDKIVEQQNLSKKKRKKLLKKGGEPLEDDDFQVRHLHPASVRAFTDWPDGGSVASVWTFWSVFFMFQTSKQRKQLLVVTAEDQEKLSVILFKKWNIKHRLIEFKCFF